MGHPLGTPLLVGNTITILQNDCWASVGSANLDNRSLHLNEEANLNVLDYQFAADPLRIFEEDKSRSRWSHALDWRRDRWKRKSKALPGLPSALCFSNPVRRQQICLVTSWRPLIEPAGVPRNDAPPDFH